MVEEPRPDDFPVAARVVGVIYLTFCAGVPGGVFLFLHPASIYCRMALGASVLVGLIVALVAGIKDPAARPIRWGLLWLALGLVAGPGLVFGLAYLAFQVLGI
jgi:hypothetical protein